MSTIDEAVEVHVPVSTAYDQWTQFESFPRFMEGVEEVHQLDDTHVRWRASVGGVTREWTAVITEQVPDTRIAWRSIEGHPNAGEVRFEKRDADTTIVHLHMEHEPESTTEAVGDWLGMAKRRARQDLERFRELIERRGVEEGAWRGEVHQGDVTDPDTSGGMGGTTGTMGTSGTMGGTHETYLGDDQARYRDVTEGPTPETRSVYEEGYPRPDGEFDDDRPHHDVTEGPTPETRGAMRATEDDSDDDELGGGTHGAAI